jgi:hypothetical protein
MVMTSLILAFLFLASAHAQPSFAGEAASSPETVRPLLPGMKIPDVKVSDLDGRTVALSEVLSGEPSVLIFYRGGW